MAKEGPPRDLPPLFLDRNMGSVQVAKAIRPLWPRVEIHDDHFPATTPDTEWLEAIGRLGWAYASKDKAILRKPPELRALWRANVRAFTLRCKDCTGDMMSAAIRKATPKMQDIIRGEEPPYIYRIVRCGTIEQVMNCAEMYRRLA